MSAHERLAVRSDSLARVGVIQVVPDLLETRVNAVIPGAVNIVVQHLPELRAAVSEIESAAEYHHPGAIRRGVARRRSCRCINSRVDPEDDAGARAHRR